MSTLCRLTPFTRCPRERAAVDPGIAFLGGTSAQASPKCGPTGGCWGRFPPWLCVLFEGAGDAVAGVRDARMAQSFWHAAVRFKPIGTTAIDSVFAADFERHGVCES